MISRPDKLFDKWWEFLQVAPESDVPSVVYHYTNAAGLLGILKGKSVFATDKHFLNDKMEVRYGIESANRTMKAQAQKDSVDMRTSELLNSTCTYIERSSDERHFIFSMSERRDDLSQWRGYAGDGQGFSVGIDARRIQSSSVGPSGIFAFNRISYSTMQFGNLIRTMSKDFSESMIDNNDDIKDSAQNLSAAIDAAASFHKHASFRSEREWRIVSWLGSGEFNKVKLRSSDHRLIPYIDIPLCSDTEELPVLEIGIGPAVQNPNIRIAIEDLCRSANISPDIYDAATPFVRY